MVHNKDDTDVGVGVNKGDDDSIHGPNSRSVHHPTMGMTTPAKTAAELAVPIPSNVSLTAVVSRPDFWNNPRPTNENPNFVQDYFASSRLHFIGSFRARYESMLVNVGKQLNINPSLLLQKSIDTSATKTKLKRPSSNNNNHRIVVHIDMDAFFASVAVRDNPHLKGLPVAVCHAAGEVSTCTYEARKFGVRAGMFLRDAKKLCPTLHNVAYDFAAYERVSIQIYALFFQLPRVAVEAVSVDEAYLDVTHACSSTGSQSNNSTTQLANNNDTIQNQFVDDLVRDLRQKIVTQTGCSASAGLGPSKLVARLATKAAKPDGQFHVQPSEVMSYFDTLSVRDLPGIGWRTAQRLDNDMHIKTVPQLRTFPLQRLQAIFGDKQGSVFYDLARAIDTRPVEPLKPRRSIGAELSWGVRFLLTETDKVKTFISQVGTEVALRVSAAGAYGTKVIFKCYKRIRGADATHYKHLGHGPCTVLTKSARLPPRATGDTLEKILVDECLKLYSELNVAHDDFRGIGVQVADLTFADLKFDPVVPSVPGIRRIDSFFKPSARDRSANDIACKFKQQPVSVFETANANNIAEEKSLNVDNHDEIGVQVEYGHDTEIIPIPSDNEIQPEKNKYPRAEFDSRYNDVNITEPRSSDIADEIQPVQNAPEPDEDTVEERIDDDGDADNFAEINIPDGWDRDVFVQLPPEIQSELIGQHGTSNIARTRVVEDRRQQLPGQQPARTIQLRRPTAIVRERDRDGNNDTTKSKRFKKGAQMTMTQIVELEQARQKGTDVVNATEFRTKGLRDAVELLEDLKGAGDSRQGSKLIEKHSRRGVSAAADAGNIQHQQSQDIPSPPSLSSDSENDGMELSLDEVVDKLKERDVGRMYADESVVTYAPVLAEWMKTTSNDEVRSAHVELLRGRLLQILREGRLERLCEELRTIRRFASSAGGWIAPFNSLMSQIQQECKREYNFHLSIMKIETIT